ncbi:MAG TPA: hypothetical protein VJP45_00260, partial [Candidatus Limnocylindria bacterium]|nr:hypothetical protein [Candidatus Limnocylindria bacterium]
MLTCYMCGETKPEADFAFADIARGIRQRHCRTCHAAYRRAHYLANRETYIKREAARIKHFRIENRALMIAYLLAHPCVDCGETDPVKLDFDHRDPSEKSGNIGFIAARKPWHLVLREIAKCDVRCANCHMRRTAEQFNWRKARAEAPGWDASNEPAVRVRASDNMSPESGLTRVCTGCHVERPIEEFRIKDTARGTRRTRCNACLSAYGKAHYQTNRAAYIAR